MLDHEWRQLLNDEIHGRPGLPVEAPARITHLAFTLDRSDADPLPHIKQLCDAMGIKPPVTGASHHGVELKSGIFKYERHGEFYRISITTSGRNLTGEALAQLPVGWIDGLPGKRLVAIHTHIFAKNAKAPSEAQVLLFFAHDEVAASRVHQGRSTVWSDFRIGTDGFTRMLIHDGGVSPHRLGRLTRRLHEIETYRMMALLAYPVARELQPQLGALERGLSTVVENVTTDNGAQDDANLLQQLSRIARDVERISNLTSYRFAAAQAYAALVRKRIDELDEERMEGFQRLGVFLERRFSPAMSTCTAVSNRIVGLAQRSERAGNLLRTRVDIALEAQNQKLLQSMEKRVRQQLMLQETVEGLSVAAISYYVIVIVDKLLAGTATYLPGLNVKLVGLTSIPLIVAGVWYAVRRLRKRVLREAA
jgi:uncharacterized membrane-anchored protein